MDSFLFVTPCGASIIANAFNQDFKEKFNESIYNYSNWSEEKLKKEKPKIYQFFEEIIPLLREKLLKEDEKRLRKLSAELNALLIFFERNSVKTGNNLVNHILIPTDTYYGKLVSSLLKTLIEQRFKQTVIYAEPIKDLRTSSLEEFHWALKDLASKLIKELDLEGYRQKGYKVIFNLTGGFKSINSFLQVMASLYADESIYIFETSNELLTIPKLPIKVDMELFEKYLDFFRALELKEKVGSSKILNNFLKEIPSDIPESLIIKLNGEISLSPYGELLWLKAKQEIYSRILVEPLSEKLIYTKAFEEQFKKLNDREKRFLNLALDNFNLYLLTNHKYNPSSLRVHEVKNHPEYDLEFYPFEGNDSRRAYIKRENGKYLLLKIGSHLK